MKTINSYLSFDHRNCDESLAKLEGAVSEKRWDEARNLSDKFCKEMHRHFNLEENILFPAFEEKTGMLQGPTMVMRMEHLQMKGMMSKLPEAITNKNEDRVLGITETLMIFIQQHNNKEEQMLYNMCDMHLANQVESLIAQMNNFSTFTIKFFT